MRALAYAGLATILVAAACGLQQSGLDPNAQVTISGKALAADGGPLAGTKVALIKELDIGESIGGLFVTAVTLGLACLSNHPPALCANNSHVATTGTDGSFTFSIKGSDTQGSVGLASTMEVMTRAQLLPDQTAGAVAMEEFTVEATSLQLPDLRTWTPSLSWSADAQTVRVGWPPLPSSGYGGEPRYALEFDDSHLKPAWVTGSVTPNDSIDARLIEDSSGGVHVVARASGTASGTTVDFTYLSGSIGANGTAGAPPSRGAACAPVIASGIGQFNARCPLTSGDFGNSFVTGSAPSGAVIDLGTERAVSLVVVRGCSGQCHISVSSDLSAWSDAGSLSGEFASAPITLNRSARYIRLLGTPNVPLLHQVSVW